MRTKQPRQSPAPSPWRTASREDVIGLPALFFFFLKCRSLSPQIDLLQVRTAAELLQVDEALLQVPELPWSFRRARVSEPVPSVWELSFFLDSGHK